MTKAAATGSGEVSGGTMTATAPDGFYVYQPDPPRPDGRIYAVSGFDSFDVICKRLTKEEATVIANALNENRKVQR